MYPTDSERGASPPKKLVIPAYSEGWELVKSCLTVFVVASILLKLKFMESDVGTHGMQSLSLFVQLPGPFA